MLIIFCKLKVEPDKKQICLIIEVFFVKVDCQKDEEKERKTFGWKRQFEKQKVGTKNGVYKKCIKNFSFPNLIIVDICNIRKSH